MFSSRRSASPLKSQKLFAYFSVQWVKRFSTFIRMLSLSYLSLPLRDASRQIFSFKNNNKIFNSCRKNFINSFHLSLAYLSPKLTHSVLHAMTRFFNRNADTYDKALSQCNVQFTYPTIGGWFLVKWFISLAYRRFGLRGRSYITMFVCYSFSGTFVLNAKLV